MLDAAPGEAPYVDAVGLALNALTYLEPPERLTVPQYAARHRVLNNAGGGRVGPWLNEDAPYTVQPSEVLDSLDHLTIAVVGPGQVGKTVIPENWLMRSVHTDPANMLWYMQTDDGIESYVKSRINEQIIDLHEPIRARLGRRAVDDSLHYKRFDGMSIEFLAASPSTLINKSAPRIVVDEWDNLQLLNPKPMFDVRRQTFGAQSMLLALSHPDQARSLKPTEWTAGIMALFADSDRRLWYWPCPHCGAWSSPCPTARRQMVLDYIQDPDADLDEVAASAHLLCPVNGCVVEDHHRKAMNLAAYQSSFGGWVGLGQELSEDGVLTGELVKRETAGFWIHGAMSPFVLGGIHGLVRERVKAERAFEIGGDDDDLKQVIIKQWGEPYVRKQGAAAIDADVLADRADRDLQLGLVPEGVRFITLFVDVQKWGFDYLYRGWGAQGESWVIDRGRLSQDPDTARPIEPATSGRDWDRLLDLFNRRFPLADGSGRVMRIRAMGIDSRGEAGVTQQAYSAWRRWKRQKIAKFLGQDSGREMFNIVLTGGASSPNAPKLTVVYPDTARKANAAAKGQVPVASFNPNRFKDDLAGQLRVAQPAAWYVHFPWALRSEKSPHAFFEQVTAEHEIKPGVWDKKVASARNEALDQLVGTHVLAHLHGLSRMDWDKPRAWAGPWDVNTYVEIPAAAAETAAPDRDKPRKSLASRLR